MKRVDNGKDKPFYPLFSTMIIPDSGETDKYLPEDYAFSERVVRAGYKPKLDTSAIVLHTGTRNYSVFDMQLNQKDA